MYDKGWQSSLKSRQGPNITSISFNQPFILDEMGRVAKTLLKVNKSLSKIY